RHLAVRVLRRHDLVGVSREHPLDGLALAALARADRSFALAVARGLLEGVEPQAGLALVLVGAVTEVAVLGKDWLDVAVEVKLAAGGSRGLCARDSDAGKSGQQDDANSYMTDRKL